MNNIKKIGILTSGGDCAGLNAVIMAVVNAATKQGWTVYGIHDGTDGLTNRPLSYEILTEENFSSSPWPRMAGSYLGSLNTGVKESQEVLAQRFGEGVRELGLDAVVVVGGDGSMNIVSTYCKMADVKMIGIPKTIDNDTPLTEFSVGFNTACQVCTNALDDLMTTARSHHRALILEVMGRDAGHLAMHSAIAGFADICLVPEIPYTLDGIVKKLEAVKASGRTSALIVVSEGVKTEKGEAVTSAVNMVGEKINGGIGDSVNEDNGEEFPTPMSTAIGESFIRFNVEDLLPRIAPRAVFVGHGYYNELHQRVEAEEAYRLAQEPKQLYYVDGKHNEWMFDDDPKFQALADALAAFYKENLKAFQFGLQK